MFQRPDGFGKVKFFKATETDPTTKRWKGGYGFIVRPGQPDLFCHVTGGRDTYVHDVNLVREAHLLGTGAERTPQAGDELVYWTGQDAQRREVAIEWAFADDWRKTCAAAQKPILFRVVRVSAFKAKPDEPEEKVVWQGQRIADLEGEFPRHMDGRDELSAVPGKDFVVDFRFERQDSEGNWSPDFDRREPILDPKSMRDAEAVVHTVQARYERDRRARNQRPNGKLHRSVPLWELRDAQ